MKKLLLFVMAITGYASTSFGQTIIPLYDEQIPNSKPHEDVETTDWKKDSVLITGKISRPTLTVFLPPKEKATGAAVIICPGGGYVINASKHEGTDVAERFTEMGVAAFVLKYRIPNDAWMIDRKIGPLQDAQRAILLVREGAKSWGIDPRKVGIMGFSAGGHLAATAGTHYKTPVIDNPKKTSLRPDFMVLVYPVISFGESVGHSSSRKNLLGKDSTLENINLYSAEKQVTANTPPSFLVHAKDDAVKVENSLLFAEALKKHGVQYGMHLYESGGHGFGMYNKENPVRWMDLVEEWLKALQIINGRAAKEIPGTVAQLPGHPRILLLKGEENKILQAIKKDPVWANLQQAILSEAGRLLEQAPLQRKMVGRRLLEVSREALRRIFFLSYAYRTTRDARYLQRAETEMLAVAAFSNWNPSHFLDVAEMALGVAIGYDWLYSDLSPAVRTTIRKALLQNAIEPSLDKKYNHWLKVENNWNQVCNAGMAFSALAIYEDHPELAKMVLNRAVQTIPLAMAEYAPDGAYPEGYSYWGYGTSFNVLLIDALEKLFKTDFGLSQLPGFLESALYLQHMTGPAGLPFNYSDAGARGGLHSAMFWFAAKTGSPSLLWVERSYLTGRPAESHVRNRLLPAILLWGNAVSVSSIRAPQKTVWVGKGRTPVALMRTSWTDSSAIYVGLKGGSPSVNHGHMDIGSFVMDADGVRWAMDFGTQGYESLESKGLNIFSKGQDAQRWQVFRFTNLVHNTLTFDGKHQLVDGYAPVNAFSDRSAFKYATTDMTAVYGPGIGKAERGIAIVNNNQVIVQDEIKTGDQPTTVRWTLLTPASVEIIGNKKALLTQGGKQLWLEVASPENLQLKTWSTTPPNDFDAPNPGTTLVGFEVVLPANNTTTLQVLLTPGKESKGKPKLKPLQAWGK